MNEHTNPIALRVQNGTLPSDGDLCASCRWAIIRHGSQSGFAEVRCNAMANSPRVPEKMATCTAYLERGKLSLPEMSQIAWVIEQKGKHIGFLTPEDLERRRMNQPAPSTSPVGF